MTEDEKKEQYDNANEILAKIGAILISNQGRLDDLEKKSLEKILSVYDQIIGTMGLHLTNDSPKLALIEYEVGVERIDKLWREHASIFRRM
tara:strand:+ start:684 stop:956 length:273 start_codon:yes stop_codon:yes gene_type:complete